MAVATIEIEDYPFYDLAGRYGGPLPVHPELDEILARGLAGYESTLADFAVHREQLSAFRRQPCEEHPHDPAWDNDFLPPLDTVALFGMVSSKKPAVYLEVGSGNSTKVAARARDLNSPETSIVSIDPSPKAQIDELCDEVVRGRLEDNPAMCDRLGAGDILFIDGTHRILQGSDTTVFFLEILPRLRSGVYIHVHDIFWPDDYHAAWKQRMYSEQYMLGLLLLFGWSAFETILPCHYVTSRTPLLSILDDVWTSPQLRGLPIHGGSFWFRKR